MTDTYSFLVEADILRKRTLHILEDIAEKSRQYKLSKLTEILDIYSQKLTVNRYTVLVVGEVSRGKSSFVNALIGQDLLPMHASVTTNQVFRVTNTPREAYRLRFENGTPLPISKSELEAYGSQTATNQQGTSHINLDLLKWIEVDVPCYFLPPNVSLLDTPGLGSLYAAHAQITQRFIPYADAVIFVLDSRSEMGQTEKDYIEAILNVTNHIFFIQTHIDSYDETTWRDVQRKNQAILQKQFKGRLNDTRVWPISNTNMMKAAKPGEDEAFYRFISHQEDLQPALEAFLFMAAGSNRCIDALKAANLWYIQSHRTMARRLATLNSSTKQKQQELQQSEAQFVTEWGPQGQKRKELETKIHRVVSTNRQSMLELLSVGQGIEKTQRMKIDALTSTEEAIKLAKLMPEQVITEVVNKWRSVCKEASQQCTSLLRPLVEDADALLPQADDPNLIAPFRLRNSPTDELLEYIAEFPNTFLNNWQATYLLIVVAAPFIHIAGGILLAGAAIAGIWGVARRLRFVKAAHLAEAQEKLHNDLSDLMREIRDRFQQPDPMYDDKSLIKYYFDTLMSKVNELIENFVEQKRKEAETERSCMQEQRGFDPQQRAVEAQELRERLKALGELGNAIKANLEQLNALKQP